MAESVVSFVVERLGDLVIQEADFLKGVRHQVKQIQVELKRMQCFLRDADKRQAEDEGVRNWVSEIKDVAYDVEDIIQTFASQVSVQNKGGVRRYTHFFKRTVQLHKVGSGIEAIKTRISDLTRSLQTYGINAVKEDFSSFSEVQRELRWSYSHIIEEHIVGIDENIKEIVGELVNEGRRGRIVSICGMGGLGKTTIAKEVYHQSNIRRHFEGFAWACVSQQCKKKEVWVGILLKLTSPSKEERDQILRMTDEELAKKLYELQREKKCLVILDDIWTTEAWGILKPAFPVGIGLSRLLLTTRNKEVAKHVDQRGLLHEPGCFNEQQSWELFRKKAFPRRDDSDYRISNDIEELGREMVARCAGLPLAINVLGGLLATKETVYEWDIVRRNINSYFRKGHDQQHSISDVLALSYHDMPPQLKPCFLYLSQFPEDSEIPAKKLIRLWIAEGIVSPQNESGRDETLEELGDHYLGSLISRCLVQVGIRGSTGSIKTCRIHDLMRDLCLSRARDENFLQIVSHWDDSRTKNTIPPHTVSEPGPSGRIRRLAVFLATFVDEFIPAKNGKNSRLRSLIYFHDKKCRLGDWKVMKPLFNFKFLRVLDLEGVKGSNGELPQEIGSLILLRFLSLKNTRVHFVPSSIGNLVYLQTLNLQTIEKLSWGSVVQIPDVVWKMEQLRHLYLPKWCGNKTGKLQLANLRNLQALINFPANICDVNEILSLENLRKFVLNDSTYFEKFVEIFQPPTYKLNHLQSLSLKTDMLSLPDKVVDLRQLASGCPRLRKLHIEGRIGQLPDFQQFPPYLTKLTLWGSRLVEDPMRTLEKLPHLTVLNGWEMFVGKKMVCSERGFPKLKSLHLRGLHNLEDWVVEDGAMNGLRRLGISDCNSLMTVPEGLRTVSTLEELEVRWMPLAFKRRLEEGGEDFYKVQHVTSIVSLN